MTMSVTQPALERAADRLGDSAGRCSRPLTARQGQYLAFIRTYTLIHREAPAETDMQRFFRVTQPSVHHMILALEKRGALSRVPGRTRSIRVLVPPEDVPLLEEHSDWEGRNAWLPDDRFERDQLPRGD